MVDFRTTDYESQLCRGRACRASLTRKSAQALRPSEDSDVKPKVLTHQAPMTRNFWSYTVTHSQRITSLLLMNKPRTWVQ